MIISAKYSRYWRSLIAVIGVLTVSSTDLYAGKPKDWNDDIVFILPEAGRGPTIEAFEAAEKSIQFAGYKLSDEKIIAVLKRKAAQGVRVELLVEHEIFKHDTSSNVDSPLEDLKKLPNFFVHPRPSYVKQVHQKLAIIDGDWAFMTTGNYDTESFEGDKAISAAPCRDFFVPIFDEKIVKEMQRVFQADCHGEQLNLKESDLIWGPDNQREKLVELIRNAKESLEIYQQDISDPTMKDEIVNAIKRGVKVQVINIPFPFSKKQDNNIPTQQAIREAGGFVGLSSKNYMHAKVIIIDGTKMAVFSTNFYKDSLDHNREFGLIIVNLEQIRKVRDMFKKDWQASNHN